MGNKLYVGNLAYGTGSDALRDLFAQVGEVAEVHVVMDRETGRSRGFAFVTMAASADAAKAINELNSTLLEGRPLRVNEAEERGRGGSAGGGGSSDGPRRGGHRGW